MRDILTDAEAHREDGYGRSQKQQKQQLPKRFYKSVDVVEIEGNFLVQLDGKPIKTPGKNTVAVPSDKLAQMLKAEWEAQEKEIDPAKMPVTRLVNTIVERAAETLDAVKAEIVKFAGNDLMLYRADSPVELVELQEKQWGAALALFEKRYDVRFEPITGIMHKEQPAELATRLNEVLDRYGAFSSFATMLLTSITGSGVLAVGLAEDIYPVEEAWENAYLDENYQAQLWGEDAEALRVRKFKRTEFDAALAVLGAVKRAQ
jgi:chaperone required for assembly of F1-ATPase